MKVGERGQVTIPKPIRDRFGIEPHTDVEFAVVDNAIVLRKKPGRIKLSKWKGYCRKSFRELGYSGVDEFIDDIRGR